MLGELAQLGERLVCNQEVTGSSPVFSTLFEASPVGSREVRRAAGRAPRERSGDHGVPASARVRGLGTQSPK